MMRKLELFLDLLDCNMDQERKEKTKKTKPVVKSILAGHEGLSEIWACNMV